MGFLTLEDLTGTVECLVFPKVFERYQGLLAADDVVVLSGKLSIREEESPKLLVDRVTPLDEWKEQKRDVPAAGESLLRTVPPAQKARQIPQQTDAQLAQGAKRKLYLRLNREEMEDCTGLLSLYPGSVPVYLHIPAEKMTFLVPKVSWCDAGEACLQRLAQRFGMENVKMVEK